MPRDTGFPRADVENDFLRLRRRQILARLAHRLSREPDDVNLILPFDVYKVGEMYFVGDGHHRVIGGAGLATPRRSRRT